MTVHRRDQFRLALPVTHDEMLEAAGILLDQSLAYADRCGYQVLTQRVETIDDTTPDGCVLLIMSTELVASTEGEWPSVHAAFAEDGWSR